MNLEGGLDIAIIQHHHRHHRHRHRRHLRHRRHRHDQSLAHPITLSHDSGNRCGWVAAQTSSRLAGRNGASSPNEGWHKSWGKIVKADVQNARMRLTRLFAQPPPGLKKSMLFVRGHRSQPSQDHHEQIDFFNPWSCRIPGRDLSKYAITMSVLANW